MAGYDGSITLRTKVDTTGIKTGAKQIKAGLSGVGEILSKIGAAVGIAFGVSALVNFGKQAVSLASDLQEVQNVVDVAFGDMSYKMEQFANTAIEAYGISKLTAKQTGSSFMAMAVGIGFAREAASDMSLQLTALSADMASFYNIQQSEARTALSAVFTGETETLKRYGILITEVNLQEFARQQGIYKSINAMTQQEKGLLRYNYVMQQTALAQGDFARTSLSWANQTRILAERWNEVKITFGEAFMTIGTLVLPAINTLVKGLSYVANLAKAAAVNIAALFGKKIDTTSSNVASNTTAISSGLGSAAGNAADTASGVGNVGKEAKKTNKELKKTVASFDELNILSSDAADSAGSGGTGGGIGGLGDVGGVGTMTDGDFDPMGYANEVNAALATIMGVVGLSLCAVGLILLFTGNIPLGIGFIATGAAIFAVSAFSLSGEKPTNEAINGLVTLMGVAGGALAAIGIFLCFMGSWAWGIGFIIAGAAALGAAIVAISKSDTSDIQTWISLIAGIASGAMLALGIILVVFGVITPLSIGLIVAGALGLAATIALNSEAARTAITQWISDNSGVIVGISLALLVLGIVLCLCGVITPLSIGLIAAGAVGLATTLAIDFNGVINKVSEFIQNNSGIIVGISLALLVLGIVLCCCGVITPLSIGLIAAGAVGLATVVALNFNAIKTNISNFIKDNTGLFVGIGLALVVLGVVLICTGVGIPLGIGLIVAGGASLAAAIAPNWGFIKEKVSEMWNSIKAFWNAHIAKIFTKEWWANLFKKALNGAIGIVESFLNFVTGGFRNLANSISGLINAAGDVIGVDINIPQIPKITLPRLAQGAVLPPNKPFMAVVGDQTSGTNIEAPLDTIKQALLEVLEIGGSGGNSTVILELDGRELGRAIINVGKQESRRLGTKVVFG